MIKNFCQGKTLESLSIDSKFHLLIETINIFQNYIPNKKIKCNYRWPPRMTNSTKRSLKECSKLTKCYHKNGQKKSYHLKLSRKS